jgi:predicted DNA-binding transcriptional regulator AlpA
MPQTEMRPLATVDEFCQFAGLTRGQAAQMRYMGSGPEFVKITGRQVRYEWSSIERWVESRTRSRTDDPPNPTTPVTSTTPDHAAPRRRVQGVHQ